MLTKTWTFMQTVMTGIVVAVLARRTLQLFVQVARAATPLVLAAMLLAVGYLGWLAGARFQSQVRSPGG